MKTLQDLYAFADRRGYEVDAFEMQSREAFSVQLDGECRIAIDPFKLKSNADEKDKLGHELGHCETGAFYNVFAACDVRQKHENRADRWKINALIPRDELEAAVAAGRTEAWELAELFDVPERCVRQAVWYYQRGNMAMDWGCCA